MNSYIMREISHTFALGSATPLVFQELDHIESTCMIIFYLFCYDLLDFCHALRDCFRILKIYGR
jgi:hypothetical protein